jgi:DDE_Tnp_1-associated
MVTYPLDELLLATLVGVVCAADDWDGVEEVAKGALAWLRGFLPYRNGVATAQTFRKVFRLLDAEALTQGFQRSSSKVTSIVQWRVFSMAQWARVPARMAFGSGAVIRHAAFNILKADKSRGSLKRKRLRACIDPKFRSQLFKAA